LAIVQLLLQQSQLLADLELRVELELLVKQQLQVEQQPQVELELQVEQEHWWVELVQLQWVELEQQLIFPEAILVAETVYDNCVLIIGAELMLLLACEQDMKTYTLQHYILDLKLKAKNISKMRDFDCHNLHLDLNTIVQQRKLSKFHLRSPNVSQTISI
jgi:hypothetical protein